MRGSQVFSYPVTYIEPSSQQQILILCGQILFRGKCLSTSASIASDKTQHERGSGHATIEECIRDITDSYSIVVTFA